MENTDGISSTGSGTVDNPSAANITAEGITITFTKSDDTKYDLDTADKDYEKARYPKAKLPDGTDYFPIHKAVVEGETDEFLAKVKLDNTNIAIDSLVFKTVAGAKIDAIRNGTTFTINLKGTSSYKNEEAIVTYKDSTGVYKIAASFFIHHIKKQDPVDVVVVSVNGTQLSSDDLQKELNTIFGKAGANFRVTQGNALELNSIDWDTNANGIIDYEKNGLFSNVSNYPAELAKIHGIYKDRNNGYNAKAYHIFLLPDTIKPDKAIKGFMPKTALCLKLANGAIFLMPMIMERS